MVFLRIDPNDAVPLGVQIARGIRLAVAQGRIAAGEQLPSARQLAASLQVNFHTVRKAFGELESEGVLEFRRGRGTSVAEAARRLRAPEVRRLVREHVSRLLGDFAGIELDADDFSELVADELRKAMRNRRNKKSS